MRDVALVAALLLSAGIAETAHAQRPAAAPMERAADDVCAIGEAEAVLDAGGARAPLFNIGGLF